MKPSYYLEPDAEKVRSFFRTFSLHEDLISDLEKISINKIWIDETDNSWELEYTHSESIDSQLPDALTSQIISFFNLKNLCWKKPEQENSSVPLPDSEVRKDNDPTAIETRKQDITRMFLQKNRLRMQIAGLILISKKTKPICRPTMPCMGKSLRTDACLVKILKRILSFR